MASVKATHGISKVAGCKLINGNTIHTEELKMTTEKIMENLLVIADSLDTDERKFFDFVRKNNIKKSTFAGAGARLGELYITLAEQFRLETARKLGKSSVKHGMESILKSAEKINPCKTWLHYAYNDGDFQVACNGYMIAALSKENHVPLAERPDDNACKWSMPNWKKSIPWDHVAENRLVELPELTALKLYLKSENLRRGKKNPSPIIFDFGADLPCVKVEYLIAGMEILPDAKAYYTGHNNCCLLMKNDSGSAVYIMGMKPESDEERTRTEI